MSSTALPVGTVVEDRIEPAAGKVEDTIERSGDDCRRVVVEVNRLDAFLGKRRHVVALANAGKHPPAARREAECRVTADSR
jgi:hypothetical protein